jgi:hypothetical protein
MRNTFGQTVAEWECMAEVEGQSADRRSVLPRFLVGVVWLIPALAAFVVWTTIGFFVLMPAQAVVPVGGPEQAPMWLAYSGLVFLALVWPLLLLFLTRRPGSLNRMLMAVYAVAAIGVLLDDSLVVFARTLDSPPQRALAALLMAGAVALHGWSNKRIKLRRPSAQLH